MTPRTPNLHLRISFAGRRMHADLGKSIAPLSSVFTILEQELHTAGEALSLTMLNGLADGADQLAARAFTQWRPANETTTTRLIGVFPFALKDYLKTITDQANFLRLYEQCDQHEFLNGIYELSDNKSDSGTAHANRTHAFRQQAQYLLDHGDFILAVADEREVSKPGGSLETVAYALARSTPVLLFSLRTSCFFLLLEQHELDGLVQQKLQVHQDLKSIIEQLVRRLS